MKIIMVGQAAKHKHVLVANLPVGVEIIDLPPEAATDANFDSTIASADVVITLKLRRTSQLPQFGLLHVPGAGLDGIDFDVLSPCTTVCNVFEHEIPISEYVLASMLSWEIRLEELRQSFSPQRWSDLYRNRVPHGEVFGRVLGVVGFGRIGRAIAQRARAFSMTVIAVDPRPQTAADLADRALAPKDLPEMLCEADYVVIACPLNAATRSLIGRSAFEMMKSSAVLINISRAEIVNEAALFTALKDRTIKGATLDVWYRYPSGASDRVPPSLLPFWELDNVVCTPHSSAWTVQLPGRRYAFIAKNIARAMRGEPLLNVVHSGANAAATGW
jgi:phosphoglycerate dehydrogenase-like enzyme